MFDRPKRSSRTDIIPISTTDQRIPAAFGVRKEENAGEILKSDSVSYDLEHHRNPGSREGKLWTTDQDGYV